jgi:hypothetical protein
VGRDSSVGIATRYGLDGPGIESRWRRIFRTRPDRPWGPPSLLYNRYRVLLGVKRPGRGVDHPPHLAPRSNKEWSYTSTPPVGLRGLFYGELYPYLYQWRIKPSTCSVPGFLFHANFQLIQLQWFYITYEVDISRDLIDLF